MPDSFDYPDEEEYIENDYPPDSEELDGRCGDENCESCYGPFEQDNTAPQFWQFTATTNESWTMPEFVTPQFDPEGEEMPETPEEMPENNETSEYPTVPSISGLTFHTPRGNRMRVGAEIRDVNSGHVCQISFWDMSPNRVRNTYTLFKEWLLNNNLGIQSYSNDYFTDSGYQVNVPYYFIICGADRVPEGNDFAELLAQPDCECGTEIEFPSTVCPSCNEGLWCGTCRDFSTGVRRDETYGHYCSNCGNNCPECDSLYHRDDPECPGCYPRVMCHSCNTNLYIGRDSINEHQFETDIDGTERTYCNECYEYLCHTCGAIVQEGNIIEEHNHSCVNCVSRSSFEEWSTDELETSQIIIPTIPGRETIRLVGVEIEGANGEGMNGREGGQYLARALYGEGISGTYQMTGYHSSEGQRMTVHVERDSSVDWELVIGPMNVAEQRDVDIMNRAVKVVRNMINDGTLKLDMRAGMHVHVGADKVPFHNAYNLHKLYMYMEDFLYRLGAAKWPYHRSVNRRGRDQAGKSPIAEGKLHFARTFAGNRYYGLSFDNYFSRYFEGCRCGARQYGLFDECTCNLGKCTFEFRLFNTTANTVKIHAYLAICQALVAKAIELEEIKDNREFPTLDFTKTRASDLHPSTRNKLVREWEKRIVFVNEQLPLTPEEKKSIHYCVINSEMGKAVSNADILIEQEDN